MAGLFGSTSSTSTPTTGDLTKDVPVNNPPEDSVSEIAFSPAAEYLSAASWDGKVRIYEIDGSGNSQGKAMISHEGPVLSTCWSKVQLKTSTELPHVFVTQHSGWHEGRRGWSGQSCPNARPRLQQHDRTASRRA